MGWLGCRDRCWKNRDLGNRPKIFTTPGRNVFDKVASLSQQSGQNDVVLPCMYFYFRSMWIIIVSYRGFHITFDLYLPIPYIPMNKFRSLFGFPKFATTLAIWLRSCQWSCEVKGKVGKFVANFGTKFGIELHWSCEHSCEFFNPARTSYPKKWPGKNCRPLTGRPRTDTNWKISERPRVSSKIDFTFFLKAKENAQHELIVCTMFLGTARSAAQNL